MTKSQTFIGLALLLALAFLLVAASAEQSPSTKPSPKYRMVAQTVYGAVPRQWVLVIVTPNGYPGVTTPEKIKEYVQLTIPENATLEWAPSDVIIGGEPLQSADELKALAEYCKQRKINFVHIPGG